MPTPKTHIGPADILAREDYLALRADRRRQIAEHKRTRRVEVGPYATFYFESWETIRHQIQEMLYIEKGGVEQLAEEIEAYSPLIPQGAELVATVMFEIDDEARRKVQLKKIGGIENHAVLRIGGDIVRGIPDPHRENTGPDGKASSVQFFHFPLSPAQVEAFRGGEAELQLGFDHPNYGHMAAIPQVVRAVLAEDL